MIEKLLGAGDMETLKDSYKLLLESHVELGGKMKELSVKQKGATNPYKIDRIKSAISEMDIKRHDVHLQLRVLGRKLGKSEHQVDTDVLLAKGSLEGYGLPEFIVITSDDIGDGLNLQEDEMFILFEWESVFEGIYEPVLYTKLLHQRMNELIQLAPEMVQYETADDSAYFHDHTSTMYGVIVKQDNIDEVIKIMHENAGKVRVDPRFFSETEKTKAETDHEAALDVYNAEMEEQYDNS
ncbi:MAG: hypothetical protein JKX80_00595 [Candidatus Pacebacteria bacterium]|nr:hypothetical protein [Candidatus Paceibacterota bacterium]